MKLYLTSLTEPLKICDSWNYSVFKRDSSLQSWYRQNNCLQKLFGILGHTLPMALPGHLTSWTWYKLLGQSYGGFLNCWRYWRAGHVSLVLLAVESTKKLLRCLEPLWIIDIRHEATTKIVLKLILLGGRGAWLIFTFSPMKMAN